ncbi:putative reverse transcriptase domain-containing protein [Tanacetum coccineum]
MAPKRATRSTPVTTTPASTTTTTTSVTNAQLQTIIDQCVIAALAARDANRNDDGNHTSGTGGTRTERVSATLLKDRLRTKGSLKTLSETIKTNNRTRGRTLAGLILQGLVKRSHTGDRNPYALNATITTTVRVLQNATNATNLAILPVIVRSAGNANNHMGTGSGKKSTCFECGVQGHFKRECPKLKNNKNRGNQVGNDRAPAKVYAVRHAGTNPDSNVVTGTFLLNNRYASILFDTGADRSFVSTAFSSQMDITQSTLDHYYDVELADEKIIGLNTILRGCTLNLLKPPIQHKFNARRT